MLVSTDHNPGGIFAYFAPSLDAAAWTPAFTVFADPSVVDWATDNSVTLPDIEDETTPFYDHGTQCETPRTVLRDDGTEFLYTHEAWPSGGNNQSTMYATSTDGLNFTFGGLAVETPRDMPGESHTGYLTQPFRVGNQWLAHTFNGKGKYVLVRSYNLQNWTVDQEEIWSFMPKAFGQTAKNLRFRGGGMIHWRGLYWAIARYGDDIVGGGGNYNDNLVIFPLSSDFKRPISIPSIASAPGTNGLDEIFVNEGCLIHDDAGKLYLFYYKRNAANKNAIVRVVADPADTRVPPAAFTPTGHYTKLVLDHEGKISGYGPKSMEMVLQDHKFGLLSALPADMIYCSLFDLYDRSNLSGHEENFAGVSTSRGYLELKAPGHLSEHGIAGMEINPAYFREVWLDVYGLNNKRAGIEDLVHLGFKNSTSTNHYAVADRENEAQSWKWYTLFIREAGLTQRTLTQSVNFGISSRNTDPQDTSETTLRRKLSVGIIQRHDSATNANEWFLCFTVNDMPFAWEKLVNPANMALRPFIAFRQDGTTGTVEMRLCRFSLRAIPK